MLERVSRLAPAVLYFELAISYYKFSLFYIFCIQSHDEKSRVFFNVFFNNLMHWKKKIRLLFCELTYS